MVADKDRQIDEIKMGKLKLEEKLEEKLEAKDCELIKLRN